MRWRWIGRKCFHLRSAHTFSAIRHSSAINTERPNNKLVCTRFGEDRVRSIVSTTSPAGYARRSSMSLLEAKRKLASWRPIPSARESKLAFCGRGSTRGKSTSTLHIEHSNGPASLEAKPAVHCVIIGLAKVEPATCIIFDYPNIKGEPVAVPAKQINAYLVNGPHLLVPTRTRAPVGFPPLFQGSKPADGARLRGADGRMRTTSNLILDGDERTATLARAPSLKEWLRPYVGGDELISGEWRWCLWLKDAKPSELASSPELKARLDRVRAGRLKSPTASVREFANFSLAFHSRPPT
jgi:hypothetical protein